MHIQQEGTLDMLYGTVLFISGPQLSKFEKLAWLKWNSIQTRISKVTANNRLYQLYKGLELMYKSGRCCAFCVFVFISLLVYYNITHMHTHLHYDHIAEQHYTLYRGR